MLALPRDARALVLVVLLAPALANCARSEQQSFVSTAAASGSLDGRASVAPPPDPPDRDDGQWTMAAKNYASTRFSGLHEINTANVSRLPVTTVFFAHTGARGLGTAALGNWTWEPFTIVLLILSVVLYARGLTNLWRRAGRGEGVRAWEAASFALGIGCLAVALLSPLTWLSDILFSAHMTQHELLMLVAAPLLVFGRPLFVALWALSPERRESTGRQLRRRGVVRSWHALTAPLTVFALHGIALWIWHVPALYGAALAHDGIHALQHVCFVVTAALFWWGMVNGRYGRIGYGAGVFYVFVTALHSSILGALMTIAPSAWYAEHERGAAAWQIDPLADQQLAGLLMWIPSGVIFIVFGLALLAAWIGEAERRSALGSVGALGPGSLDSGSAGSSTSGSRP